MYDWSNYAEMMQQIANEFTTNYNTAITSSYRWFTVSLLILGIFLNIMSFVRLTIKWRSFIFLPYLIGLVTGNLVFLSLLTFYMTCVNFSSLECGGCRFVIFGMSSMSHAGTLCLTAVAVERYVAIFFRKFISTRHRFGRRRQHKDRHQSLALLLLFLYCLVCFGWTLFAAGDTLPHATNPNSTSCGIDNNVLGEDTSNGLMIGSIVLTYFLPFLLGTTVNFLLILRLIRSSTPDNFTTMVTRRSAKLSDGVKDSIVSVSQSSNASSKALAQTSIDQLSLASVCISETLHARKERTKRNVLLMFTAGMTLDLLMNFPNRFINVAMRTDPDLFIESHGLQILNLIGYILWHVQFCVSPLFIWLPLFHRRRKLSVRHQIVEAARVAMEVDKK